MVDAFRVDGVEAFERSLLDLVETARLDASRHVRDLTYRITFNLVMETPQYSGAAASAWRVGIGTPEYVTEKPKFALAQEVDSRGFKVDVNPFSKRRRNMSAVNEALGKAAAKVAGYQVPLVAGGLPIYIVNGLPYTHWFEVGEGQSGPSRPLRMVNLPQRKVGIVVAESVYPSSSVRF